MKHLLSILIALTAFFPHLGATPSPRTETQMAEKAEVTFFVRAIPDRREIIIGDSLLVSYVLYSSAPFSRVESNDPVKVKDARVRPLRIDRDATAGRTMENGRTYYTLVWAQYVVTPEQEGEITLPACDFSATLLLYPAPRDPFEAFFGTTGKPREVKAKAKNDKLRLIVKPKPKRTNEELRRQGGFT